MKLPSRSCLNPRFAVPLNWFDDGCMHQMVASALPCYSVSYMPASVGQYLCYCSVDFMVEKLQSYLDSKILGCQSEHIWVNPDCGLKTRDWKEVIPSLENMVKAAATMRARVQVSA